MLTQRMKGQKKGQIDDEAQMFPLALRLSVTRYILAGDFPSEVDAKDIKKEKRGKIHRKMKGRE